jgi:putative PEP-CTERM system histidine kinase
MLNDLSLISHATAAIAYALLAGLVATRYLRRDIDRSIFLAALVSVIWATSMITQTVWQQPNFVVRYLLELLRDAAWVVVLFALLRDAFRTANVKGGLRRIMTAATLILIITLLGAAILEYTLDTTLMGGKTKVVGQMALALLGLSLVEQIWRNAISFGRSSMKYVCIAVASLFAYDFFMYADALLFGQIADSFWSARGLVNAAIAPLLAVNVINTRKQPVDFQLSRSTVFHAGALILAGGYLIFLAIGGYYVRMMGGDWGDALRVLFLTAALIFLVMLATSRRVRARLMVFIGQNFFDYKYDYRDEWLKMTRELANLSDSPPLPERVIRILAGLVESNAGAIWVKEDRGDFVLKSAVNLAPTKYTTIDASSEIIRFFSEREWIVDLHEYRSDPVRYNLLEIPDPISQITGVWLVIPLYLGNDLYGIAAVGNPYARVELNWENFDLVKVVARQTCNLLAQADAQSRLSQAMQFEAVSKASAFMVHDLKTLIAQLSLLVKNAPRHRDNPEFIDDMIKTTDHAVRKMASLVDHIRKPADETLETEVLELGGVVDTLAEQFIKGQPAPRVISHPDKVYINADPEQLYSILSHLIQNAQDATPSNGEVTLTLKAARDNVVLFIQDTGTGMTEDFIESRLFKPFESTKGLTGMGIGAYQAREYVRNVGGNIDVTSEPDVGSCFSIRFPLARPGSLRATPTETPDMDPLAATGNSAK